MREDITQNISSKNDTTFAYKTMLNDWEIMLDGLPNKEHVKADALEQLAQQMCKEGWQVSAFEHMSDDCIWFACKSPSVVSAELRFSVVNKYMRGDHEIFDILMGYGLLVEFSMPGLKSFEVSQYTDMAYYSEDVLFRLEESLFNAEDVARSSIDIAKEDAQKKLREKQNSLTQEMTNIQSALSIANKL